MSTLLSPSPALTGAEIQTSGQAASRVRFTYGQVAKAVSHWERDMQDRAQAKPGAQFGPNGNDVVTLLASMALARDEAIEVEADSHLARLLAVSTPPALADLEEQDEGAVERPR